MVPLVAGGRRDGRGEYLGHSAGTGDPRHPDGAGEIDAFVAGGMWVKVSRSSIVEDVADSCVNGPTQTSVVGGVGFHVIIGPGAHTQAVVGAGNSNFVQEEAPSTGGLDCGQRVDAAARGWLR